MIPGEIRLVSLRGREALEKHSQVGRRGGKAYFGNIFPEINLTNIFLCRQPQTEKKYSFTVNRAHRKEMFLYRQPNTHNLLGIEVKGDAFWLGWGGVRVGGCILKEDCQMRELSGRIKCFHHSNISASGLTFSPLLTNDWRGSCTDDGIRTIRDLPIAS